MARHSLIGGLFKVTTAAAAVAGIAYLFKDEIRGTEAYQTLNDKYDVDKKVTQAAEKAKVAANDISKKAKVVANDLSQKAFDLKDKAVKNAPWGATDNEDIFEDDEIVLNDADSSETVERDYVEITDNIAEKANLIAEKAKELKDAAIDKFKEIKEAVAEKAEEAKKAEDADGQDIADKVEDIKDSAADKVEDIKDAATDKADDLAAYASDMAQFVSNPDNNIEID